MTCDPELKPKKINFSKIQIQHRILLKARLSTHVLSLITFILLLTLIAKSLMHRYQFIFLMILILRNFKELVIEAVALTCSAKKVFLEISQNSQENTCARVSFIIKFAGLRSATLLKRRLQHRYFPVYFAKFLRTPFYRTPLDDCFFLPSISCLKVAVH